MKTYTDKFDQQLKNGDVINIHQTVNGCNIFVVLNIEPLDIRYGFDLNYKYQYSQEELLEPNRFNGDIEFEIIGNLYKHLKEF